MAAIYVDTSVLVKFYYPEPDSDKVEAALLAADGIHLSWLSIVEMSSALAKKVRTGDLEKQAEMQIWHAFLEDLKTDKVEMTALDERHYLKAAELIRDFGGKHGLKTLDSLHLAIAHSLPNAKFFCSDRALTKVASKLGVKLMYHPE